MDDQEIKINLFREWVDNHLTNFPAPLFDFNQCGFFPCEAAGKFLSANNDDGMYLYVLFVKNSSGNIYPVYIGKTVSLYERWINGHSKKLQKAFLNKGKSDNYRKWITALRNVKEQVFLGFVHESSVKYPPIPDFPTTIGSIEYQLISLATDAFPGKLLNSEGVAR